MILLKVLLRKTKKKTFTAAISTSAYIYRDINVVCIICIYMDLCLINSAIYNILFLLHYAVVL